MFTSKRFLLVEAHPDDVVWGCGGSIAKLSKKNQFKSVAFTSCTEDPLNEGILEENIKALNSLGVIEISQNGLPRRELSLHTQEIRDVLYKIKMEYRPNVVLCTSSNDLHQDHSLLSECCVTIFRDSATILAYPILRSLGNFRPSCFVELSIGEMKAKLKALSMFRTQYRRSYFKKRVVWAEAIYYGTQINVEYAEAFEALRWLI